MTFDFLCICLHLHIHVIFEIAFLLMSWQTISAFTIIRIAVLESPSVMNFMVETSRQNI